MAKRKERPLNPQLFDGKDGVLVNAAAIAVALGYKSSIAVINLARKWGLGQMIGCMMFYTGPEVQFLKTRRNQIGPIPPEVRVALEQALAVHSRPSSSEPGVTGNPG